MNDYFEIPVSYHGRDFVFRAKLLVTGYTHKFELDIDNQQVFFEKDNNDEYRAVTDPSQADEASRIDTGLLKAIAASIESILK